LSNHKFDGRYYEVQKKSREKMNIKSHEKKSNDDDGGSKKSFNQRNKEHMTCYCCGKKGHAAPESDQRDKIRRDEWHINKVMAIMQKDDTSKDESNRKKAWSGFQHQASQQYCHTSNDYERFNENLGDVFILDTGSTIGATIMNPKMLSNIKRAAKPLTMVTNAGSKKLFKKGNIHGFGEAWFDPDQVANIFGFFRLAEQYRITYDSDIENAFNVHTNDGIVKFKKNEDGLYVYRPSPQYLKNIANSTRGGDSDIETNLLAHTISENREGYTQRQFDNAKQARKLYHIIGCPSIENFKAILRQNIIKNCPVTIEDVNIAERIFGPDIGTLKGKSTREKTTPVFESDQWPWFQCFCYVKWSSKRRARWKMFCLWHLAG
jgi:hypothetical protein